MDGDLMKKMELIKDTFISAYNYSFEITKGIDLLSKQIRDNDSNYVETLTLLTDGLEWFLSAVEKTLIVQNQELNLEEMNQYLNDIIEAMIQGNNLYIRDIFKYEIKENIIEWQELNKNALL